MSTVANEVDAEGVPLGVVPRDPRSVIAGRYEIRLDAPLGGGGLALVYRGQDLRTRRDVAVKSLRIEYRHDPETRARFRREARLMAFLTHPNVVRVYDFVEDQGASWVVLEFVAGRSLKELLVERGSFPLAETARLLDQAAAALGHLHARGLVHLDVKPQNLLVTAEGHLKLIDFGLAQQAGGVQDTINGTTFGTAAYLAPEQACGEPVEAATDVYALGCVAYELLTGRPPFLPGRLGEIKNDVIRAHLERGAEPPSRVRPDLGLPRWVDDVLLWALAKDPTARYGSVESFARVFQAGVDGDAGEGAHPNLGTTSPVALVDVPAPFLPPRRAPTPTSRRPAPSPVPPRPAVVPAAPGVARRGVARLYHAGGRFARRSTSLRRSLWRATAGLAVGNVMLAIVLFLSQGEVPGLYEPAALGPGQTALVTEGWNVRPEPNLDAAPIWAVAAGDRVTITDRMQLGNGYRWWPVRFVEDGAAVEGYVVADGLAPETPWERLRDAVGLE